MAGPCSRARGPRTPPPGRGQRQGTRYAWSSVSSRREGCILTGESRKRGRREVVRGGRRVAGERREGAGSRREERSQTGGRASGRLIIEERSGAGGTRR